MSKNKLSHYIQQNKKLSINNFEKKIRVALLSSFTINGLSETLAVKCAERKIDYLNFQGKYNQYNQEILDSSSELYKFEPEITFLILDSRSILADVFYFPYAKSLDERKEFIEIKCKEIINLANFFVNNAKSKLLITNLNIPVYSPYGICENKTDYGLKEMVFDFNQKLKTAFMNESSIFLYDFNGFIQKFGEENIFDYRQYFLGDIKIALNVIPSLAEEFLGYIIPVKGINRKCIVLDLDNILWGGVVGEDGFDGIKLGPNSPGNAFLEFQRRLLALNQRGIILAINSRNNIEDALEVIRNHPHMVLKEENFASMRINWNDKISNIKEIALELNIGLDSLVFIDDDPVNRELMKKILPEVLTAEMPNDPSLFAKTLLDLPDFNVLKITKEDTQRSQMYFHDKKRKEFLHQTTDLKKYLKDLGIKVTIKKADDFTIPRISQLTLKTNQFNLTTHRYQEEKIKKFAEDENVIVGCAQVEDKFGNSGITGVFIIKKGNSDWLIDTFLLSCRVMGRGIEDTILASILINAKKKGIKQIKGQYIPTKKNEPCKHFLSSFGFKKFDEFWIYDLSKDVETQDHIQLVWE